MKTKPLDICYQKHYYPAIGKIYKDYNIRGGDTQRFEEMWLDRVRSYPGVDAAQPRQQSNIQWWNKSQGSRQHGKKKKKKAFLPWRVIEVEPQYQEKNSDCQEVNGLVYAQWKLSVKETY